MWTSVQLVLLQVVVLHSASGDVSHFLTPDHAVFQHFPFPFAFQHPPPIYGPPQPQPTAGGYLNPLPNQSPVAPTQATTEFTLPEIIENRVRDAANFIPLQSQYLPPEERPSYENPRPPNQSAPGYYYPRPTTTSTTTPRPIPIVVVEPSESLPPFQGYDYNAPPAPAPSTPAPVYLPPPALIAPSSVEEAAIVEQIDSTHPLRVHVKDMRCLQPRPSGYFRAALKLDTFIAAVPIVDNDSNDKRCELKLARSHVLVDISAVDFANCGVQPCGADLCLRLRFPSIRGMRTEGDAILTLHCKSQERMATKTHALKVGVANDVQSRSVGTYAHGGAQNPMRTKIELLRRSQNGFSRHLETNGAVQLGEDLLLRAHVQPGDGWNYTKLSDVSLQRISPTGALLNSASLVTAGGCVNPSMQRICNQPPTYDPPLGHKLQFKAVMFRGMQSGEELVLSMRITACLEEPDCRVSQEEECGNRLFSNVGRRRRDTTTAGGGGRRIPPTEISEISRISFRVTIDDIEMRKSNSGDDGEEGSRVVLRTRVVLILASSLGFVALMVALGVVAVWKLKRWE